MKYQLNKVSRHQIALLIIVIATGLLFFHTPTNGAFWWFESARNALSGAFVRDLILEMPLDDPVGWAEAYYAKYPSLVILYYPPMLHVVLGLAFIPLGVSHLSAMIVVFVFYFAMIVGVYYLGRRYFDPFAAAGLALAFCMSPEVSLWGRQVLLEVPMMAFLVWSVWFGLRFLDKGSAVDLYLMAFLGVCSLYTKQTGIFVILLLGLFVTVVHGRSLLGRRCFWITVVVSISAILPLMVIQLKFASFNYVDIFNHPSGFHGTSLEGLLWYLVRLPDGFGWWVVGPATAFIAWTAPQLWRGGLRKDVLFLILWFVVGYAFFSLISFKETRLGLPMYLPLTFASVGFFWLLPLPKWRGHLGLALGLTVFMTTLLFHPAPYVSGYNTAANYIVEYAPRNVVVLFNGHKDGDFIFNIRAHSERRDITILRADKLFLNIMILPSLGLGAKTLSNQEITDALRRFGVSYVVSDEKSFVEANVIRRLMEILQGDQFERVSVIPIGGSPLVKIDNLVIYRNKAELPAVPEKPDLKIKAIDWKIEGS